MNSWSEMEVYLNQQLNNVASRCKEILEESIQSEVYDKYEPVFNGYNRTYQLRDNVETEIRDGSLYVYVNTGNMHYESNNKEGKDMTAYVPMFINYGHNTDKAGRFMYDNYPSRSYIQVAKERIQRELGVDVTILINGLE